MGAALLCGVATAGIECGGTLASSSFPGSTLPSNVFVFGVDPTPATAGTYPVYTTVPTSNTTTTYSTAASELSLLAVVPTTGQYVAYNAVQTTIGSTSYAPGIYLLQTITGANGWQLSGATLITAPPTTNPVVLSLAVTSDGQDVLFTAGPTSNEGAGTLYMVPTNSTGSTAPSAIDAGYNDAAITAASNNSEVAFVRYGPGTATEVYWGTIAGGAVTTSFSEVTTDTAFHQNPTLSSDGSTIAYDDGSNVYVQIMTSSVWGTPTSLVPPTGTTFTAGLALDTAGQNIACFGSQILTPFDTYLYFANISQLESGTTWTQSDNLGAAPTGILGPYWTIAPTASTSLKHPKTKQGR
jgi:hypothetical protein